MSALLFLILAVSVNYTFAAADGSSSAPMAKAAMARWPDGKVTRGIDKLSDWAYDKSVLLAGLESLWIKTHSPEYLDYIQRSMDRLVTSDGQIPSYQTNEVSLDEIALGRQLLFLYEQTHDTKYSKAAAILRRQLETQPRTPSKGFWHKERYQNQMWLDGLYMAEPFYAQYAAMFHEPAAFDDIAHQFVLIEEHTRDPKTALLYHAWDESKQEAWANKTTGASPNFWARAMGWYTMALVDTLPYFPKDHPGRESLIAILNRLAAAVTRFQDRETGLWYQVMDKPKAPGNYFESSAACMFTYALAKGVHLGYLDSKYRQNASRAYAGIQKRFVKPDSDGGLTLTDTVYSAGLSGKPYRDGSYEYYIREKVGANDPKGIGAFLLASSEIELSDRGESK
jgi:unsaturated rhamnogalacturonyl hydrolase